ncbi:MAG: nitroreductase family protein [Dehalococcoidia bacterium]|nr:nitroreductase family protein [Dehalococcoidia bacterium]
MSCPKNYDVGQGVLLCRRDTDNPLTGSGAPTTVDRRKRCRRPDPPQTGEVMVDYEGLLELIRYRRSVRRFRSDPVPGEMVEKVLEAARHAPSAGNSQPWEFVVVEDPETKKKMSRSIVSLYKEAKRRDPTFNFKVAVQPHLFTAPVLIVICGDRRLQEAYPVLLRRNVLLRQSLAVCAYAMQLAATSLGLATAWATIQGGPPEAEVRSLLGIPDVYTVDHIMPLGYPDTEKESKDRFLRPVTERAPFRRALQEIVHYEHYDGGKFRTDENVEEFIWSRTVTRIPSH